MNDAEWYRSKLDAKDHEISRLIGLNAQYIEQARVNGKRAESAEKIMAEAIEEISRLERELHTAEHITQQQKQWAQESDTARKAEVTNAERWRKEAEQAEIDRDQMSRHLDEAYRELREIQQELETAEKWRKMNLEIANTTTGVLTETSREFTQVKAERDRLAKLVDEAMAIRMYGERAPGGNENWADWDVKAEAERRGAQGILGDDESESTVEILQERTRLRIIYQQVRDLRDHLSAQPGYREVADDLDAALEYRP